MCVRRGLVRFAADRSGGIAMIMALAVPGLAILSLGVIELMHVTKDRDRLQAMADSAALSAAGQMRLAVNHQVLDRAVAMALANDQGLTAALDRPTARFIDSPTGPAGVEVTLRATRPSFFGNLLPPGGFKLKAVARAQQLGRTPLCVLSLSKSGADNLYLPNGSIIARACLVQSNNELRMGGSSLIDAASIQIVKAIKGTAPTNSGTGAQVLDDPLASMFATSAAGPCQHTKDAKVDDDDEVIEVQPGVHCRKFNIEDGTLRFMPGVHHLKNGELQLKKGAKVIGENVTLVIWKGLKIDFSDGKVPLLDLTGSQGGAGEAGFWAGFALAVDPARGGDLTLNFNEIRRLEGVVYAPNTRLIVPGGIQSTEITPWTVVVTRELRIDGGRRLQINADYASSSVPVPNGVGNKASGGSPVHLTH